MKKQIAILSFIGLTSLGYSQWQNGTNIYNTNSGNIGVGFTSAPTQKFEVQNGSMYVNSENNGLIIDAAGLKRIGLMKYQNFNTVLTRVSGMDFGITRNTGSDIFNPSGLTYDFYLASDGKIGIGTTSPSSQLNLGSNNNHAFSISNAAGTYGFRILRDVSTATNTIKMQVGTGPSTYETKIQMRETQVNSDLLFNPDNQGKVGIGIINPSSILHVKSSTSGGPPTMIIENRGLQFLEKAQVNYVSRCVTKGFMIEHNSTYPDETPYVGEVFKVYGDGRTKIGRSNTAADALLHLYTDPNSSAVGSPYPYSRNFFIEENSVSTPGIAQTTRVKNNNTKAIVVENNVTAPMYECFNVYGSGKTVITGAANDATMLAFKIERANGANPYHGFSVLANGQTKIGLLSPPSPHTNASLSVDGKIVCKDFYVLSSAGWADFVFADNYTLPSLKDVKSYYTLNKHLPGVPSAKEIDEIGINIGEITKIQMQKIEELTIYMVQMKEEIEKLKSENETLKASLNK